MLTSAPALTLFLDHGYDPVEATDAVTSVDGPTCEPELRNTDPATATVQYAIDDETLSLTIDEECGLLEYQRRSTTPP